jgi:hypothetical protein
MRFQLHGHKGGLPVEVESGRLASAIIEFQLEHNQRVTSAWALSDQRRQWESADGLLEEFRQFDGSVNGGQIFVEPNTPGNGHPVLADWVAWWKGDIAGYIIDARNWERPASYDSPESEDETPFEAWDTGRGPDAFLGEYHSVRGAATVVVARRIRRA